ncbi:MAG: radical SAM protein, partial [Candidatus Sericytochromatia bacterium]
MTGILEGITKDHRSPVPDLLYEAEQIRRLEEIRDLIQQPQALNSATPLHRLTVFLTYRCNLACPYCKTISRSPAEFQQFPQKAGFFDQAAFDSLLASHQGTPIQHLHLTGGEATLIPGLPEMIARAKAAGVRHVSLTSNGVQAPELYRRLIEAGLDELRISLDAATPETGEALTLRPRAWPKTIRTLQALRQYRVEGLSFFLIINSVITSLNRAQLPAFLTFVEATCAPDDIKLITEVDSKADLADFPEYAEVLQGLKRFLEQAPAW